MGIKINDLKEAGIFKLVIRLADAFDPEVPEEKENHDALEGAEITIRELSAKESAALAEDNNLFMEDLKSFIVAHNIEKEDGTPADAQAVAQLVLSSQTIYAHVNQEMMAHFPLLRKSVASAAT